MLSDRLTITLGRGRTGPPSGHALDRDAHAIADHPAFVRAVIGFAGGEIPHPSEMLVATDAELCADGVARVRLDAQSVRTEARTARADGVSVRVIQGTNRLIVRLAAATRRFQVRLLHSPA